MNEPKTERIPIMVTKSQREALRKLAGHESVSAYIRSLINQAIKEAKR